MILAVSPHLDDAVFSLGATMARWAAAGEEVVLATVFTASVPDPRGFALACQVDKGVPAGVDYLRVRRDEDREAAAVLGLAGVAHLNLPEAPHRGYGSAAALFGGLREDDAAPAEAAAALSVLLERRRPARVVTCRGVGGHVDHLAVVAALGGLGAAAERWRDVPYVLRDGAPSPAPEDRRLALRPGDVARKLDACAAYATQLAFQFGGEAAMRATLGGVPETLAAPVAAGSRG